VKALAWIDGEIVALERAHVALDDPGYLLGDGVFETLRARYGRIFRWALHAERMAHGLAVLAIAGGSLAVAERAVRELAATTHDQHDVYLRVQIARDRTGQGKTTALARSLPAYPERLYRQGARLGVADWRRDPADPLAGVKSVSYLAQVRTRRRAQVSGFDDALILNTHGRVCESSYANVLARCGDVILTPGREEGALDGVTRRVLLDEFDIERYALQTRLDWPALESADDVVLVSTLAGVIPVVRIEGIDRDYAGAGGAFARRMTTCYKKLLDAA
jgi:branched-chain amino acid aminotransferase